MQSFKFWIPILLLVKKLDSIFVKKYKILTLEIIDKKIFYDLWLSVIPSLKDDQYSYVWFFSPVHVYVFKVLTIMLLFYRILYI